MDKLTQKYYEARKYLNDKGLDDPRYLFLAVMVVISLSVFWNGARIVQQNFELSQKVAQIENENEVIELENRNKELKNEYYKTDEFAEITARRVFGKAAAGEKVYIVPESVALNALSQQPEDEVDEDEFREVPKYQRNLEAWVNIYFGN